MTAPSDAKKPGDGKRRPWEDRARLKALLADQIERGTYREAKSTLESLLQTDPDDSALLDTRTFLSACAVGDSTVATCEIRCFLGHEGDVRCVAISPDGAFAASCGGTIWPEGQPDTDCSIRIWDLQTGMQLHRLQGHKNAVTSVAFTPDGRGLVSASRGGSMALWHWEQGEVVRSFSRHSRAVHAIAVSSDGRFALSACEDTVIRLWNMNTGARLRRFAGHWAGVTCVGFSSNGSLGFSGSSDNTARLWDLFTGKEVQRFVGHTSPVRGVALTSDRKTLVTASEDGTIRLWNAETGKETRCLNGHEEAVTSVAVSPDNRRILSGSADATVRLWDIEKGDEIRCLFGHQAGVETVAFSPDGRYALSGGTDRTARLWHIASVLVNLAVIESADLLGSMSNEQVGRLVDQLQRQRLLTPTQIDTMKADLHERRMQPRAALLLLLERGWLTNYQFNQLVQGHATDLRLADYVLLDCVGEGGMGKVYAARRQDDDRVVALKTVRPSLTANPGTIQHFLHEIKAMSKLSHPNIIKALGSFQIADLHFFIMEFVEGNDLEKLLNISGAFPVSLACDYIRQAALGLEHAHEHCMVHRDIKPANLFLTHTSGEKISRPMAGGVVKILDWGLAGLRTPEDRKQPQKEERMVGTADYIAPEQVADPKSSDIRADIYSLGCTLYHLLTGRAPFAGGNFLQKVKRHREEAPTAIQQIRDDIPDGLPAVLDKMMAKKCEDRYRSPAAVAVALNPFCQAPK